VRNKRYVIRIVTGPHEGIRVKSLRRIRNLLIGLSAALAAPAVFSQQAETSPDAAAMPAQRPRVGLVVAGGGANGGAHVGVLKAADPPARGRSRRTREMDNLGYGELGVYGGGILRGAPASPFRSTARLCERSRSSPG
jgi:hypothetical protein